MEGYFVSKIGLTYFEKKLILLSRKAFDEKNNLL